MSGPIRITGARITPVAFADPPLLNTVGVHQPFALRAIIQLDTDVGLTGLGETYADSRHLARLEAAADAITGLDVFALNEIRSAIAVRLDGDNAAVGTAGMITSASAVDQVLSPFEVACLDVQGHATGRPVSDLLGGAVRESVPFSAYLFYKWAAHPVAEPDSWGAALDPAGIVAQAKRMNMVSPQSNSKAVCSLPRRRWPPSRRCTRRSRIILSDWIRTPPGLPRPR
jgi:glucarate dehydratase